MRDPQRAQGHRAESCQESLGDHHNTQELQHTPGFHNTRERNPVKPRSSQRQDTHTSVMLLCGHGHMLTKDRLFKCKSLHGVTGAGGRRWETTLAHSEHITCHRTEKEGSFSRWSTKQTRTYGQPWASQTNQARERKRSHLTPSKASRRQPRVREPHWPCSAD